MVSQISLETGVWGRGELKSIANFLLKGQSDGSAISNLRRVCSQVFGGKLIVPVNSGRGALALALSTLMKAAPSRRQVLIPEYICPAVPKTIHGLY